MKQAIGFKSCYHVELIAPDTVILLSDLGQGIKLVGKSYFLLAPSLKEGVKSMDEIASLLEDFLPKEEVFHALFRLKKKEILEEKNEPLAKNIAAFCQLLNISNQVAYKRLQSTSISVHSIGEISSDPFIEKCKEVGIQVKSEGDIDVVFTDNYRRNELLFFHKKAQETKKPWFLICPLGPEIWLGPLFIPEKSGCWHCLLHALKNYRIEESLIEELQQRQTPIGYHVADLPFARDFALSWSVNEVFKLIVQDDHEGLKNKITTFNFCSSKQATHHVIKKTHCSSCGVPPKANLEPFFLEEKVLNRSHEEIYERYSHLISPVTGMVAFLEKVKSENPSPVLHNYFAGFNLADLEFVRRFPIGQAIATASGGKGTSDAQAKTSCLCEAIERYSGVFHGHEIKKEASFEELGAEAIHPYDLLLFSENQYEIRDKWNKTSHRFHYIPNRFDERKKVDWTAVWSLVNNRWKWVPTSYCYFSYVPKEDNFCKGDSNGCAAGNSKTEAILAAFFELVERDSIALWWYNQVQRPEVNLNSFSDPYIEKLQAQYHTENRKFWVLDLTSDLEIPVFAAISSDFSGKNILFGFGAHFDPKVALFRALTEMNQSLNVASWQGGKMMDANRRKWLEEATLEKCLYLTPCGQNSSYFYEKQNPKQMLQKAIFLMQSKGFDFLVLDQTHPDIGMPVFRVIIPGLRHFWNRYGPGRLYDVPVSLGWLNKKKEECQLNPIAMFI